jgi:dGTPase
MAADMAALKAFLFEQVYHHPRVMRVMQGAERIVSDLFARYSDFEAADALPADWTNLMRGLDAHGQARLAADYLAGQTDRYALAEHRRLFADTPDLR